MMQASREDTFNVMVLTFGISLIVVVVSLILLLVMNHNAYLDSYFILETFFDVQNTAASTELADLVFSAVGGSQVVPVLLIVIADNLSRILVISFIIAAVMDFLNYANVEGIINELKVRTLRGHVILCGYNEISDKLIKKLKAQKMSYVVIEPRKDMIVELNEKKIFNIVGDFTEPDALKRAGIDRAQAIVLTSESDVDNIIGSLVARRLNSKIKVMNRIKEESIRKRVYGIGTDMAVIPEHLAGIEMGDFVVRRFGV